jgi:peptide/nickel transport system substrate-binding protein
MQRVLTIGRRQWARLLSGAALGAAIPALADAPDRKGTLVLGLNIADAFTFDPARTVNYSPPLTLAAAYDTLVTMTPGHYEAVAPNLATAWERLPDGMGWRFTLRPDATFSSSNPVTADDWRFSLQRLLAIGDDPAQFLSGVASVAADAPGTLDIRLREPDWPLLDTLAATNFVVLERRVVEANGGTDLINARDADMATLWLNQNSAGSGAYVLTGWARNQRIELAANPYSWRGTPAYQRIVIRHMPDSTAQLRAIQRGDIDVAFNLMPEQIGALVAEEQTRIESVTSLDFVYLALNGDQALNPALAIREARASVGYAIDYDGLLERMLGSKAVRPASFLPIGVPGSTPAIARAIGYREDLDQARSLLAAAGLGDGFGFELSYPDSAIAGVAYTALAKKLRTDLGRVGIDARLRAMEPSMWRSQFLAGKAQAALAFWSAPVVSNRSWAMATIDRMARRVDFDPPAGLAGFVDRAAAEPDPATQRQLWVDYQKAMVYRANLLVLFQPMYQVAVRKSVGALPLTAAGWMAELRAAKPAS